MHEEVHTLSVLQPIPPPLAVASGALKVQRYHHASYLCVCRPGHARPSEAARMPASAKL